MHETFLLVRGHHGRDSMLVEFTSTYQSVPITTNAVSSNPTQAWCT